MDQVDQTFEKEESPNGLGGSKIWQDRMFKWVKYTRYLAKVRSVGRLRIIGYHAKV